MTANLRSSSIRFFLSASNSEDDIEGLLALGLEAIILLLFALTPQSKSRRLASCLNKGLWVKYYKYQNLYSQIKMPFFHHL